MTKEQIEFWKLVDRRGPDECWPWLGTLYKGKHGGYGRFGRAGKAHRLSYEYANGGVVPRGFVLHSCDNRACVNPAHLRVGGHAANMRDKKKRGRAGRCWGEAHGMAKLSDVECADIREKYAARWSCVRIHREGYQHVSYGSVWTIATKRTRANGSKRTGPYAG